MLMYICGDDDVRYYHKQGHVKARIHCCLGVHNNDVLGRAINIFEYLFLHARRIFKCIYRFLICSACALIVFAKCIL